MTIAFADKELIQSIINKEIKSKKIIEINRLGGLTNRTFHVKVVNGEYVIRLPGEGTEKIINRRDEKISTTLACNMGIDAKLYYFDEITGIKLTDYIVGAQTMHAEDMQKLENIKLATNVLKQLHNSGVNTGVSFDVIDMAEKYEKFVIENNGYLYADYKDVKKRILYIKNNYLSLVEKVPCHNDPLCENWILQKNKAMYLIDWEYAGMNDPMWDLADISLEAEFDKEKDEILLESYFENYVSIKEWNAFIINKILIDYLWSLWGKTRAVYDTEEMENYSLYRYKRMKKNMKEIEDKLC